MGPRATLRNAAGLLAIAASLALASPGVNVVRAEPTGLVDRTAPARSGERSAPVAGVPARPDTDAFLRELRRKYASPQAERPKRSEGEWVVLNSRGYNYGPPPGLVNEPPPPPPR